MKRIFCLLMLAGVAIALPIGAQTPHFDIWDWITTPQDPAYDYTYPPTRAIHLSNAQLYLPVYVRESVDDYFPMISAKIAILSHYPNANAITHAALGIAIPTGDTAQRELRYMAMLKREVQLGYASLSSQLPAQVDSQISNFGVTDFLVYQIAVSEVVSPWLIACDRRAKKIIDVMSRWEAKRMQDLGADIAFVRDSAQVSLGEKPGFTFVSHRKNLRLTTRQGATPRFYAPLMTTQMSYIHRIGLGTGGPSTAFVAAAQNPSLIKIAAGADELLAANTTRTFTAREVGRGIRIRVLQVPSVAAHLENVSLARGVVQSVDYSNVFTGERLTYTVQSEQTSVVTVRLTETSTLALTAVNAGNSNIRLVATNEAGSAVTSFLVTVTAN